MTRRIWSNPVLCIKEELDKTEVMSDEYARTVAEYIWYEMQPTIEAQHTAAVAERDERIRELEAQLAQCRECITEVFPPQ